MLAILVACACVLPGTAQAAPSRFPDVDSTHWAVDEGWIDYVADNRLMTGDSATGNFLPESGITRGQFATVLYRIANPGSDATTNPSHFEQASKFPDVAGGVYYTAAINWCRDNGITTGDSATGNFLPEDNITRAQLATMAYRFARVMGADVDNIDYSAFNATPDGDLVPGSMFDYAYVPLAWAADRGVLTGTIDDGVAWLDVRATATRAQAAKVLTVLKRDVVEMSGVYTVAFNSNGGSIVPSQTVTSGNKAQRAYPTRNGYVFWDWYADKDLTRVYGFDSNVTGNITLYAKWVTKKEALAMGEEAEARGIDIVALAAEVDAEERAAHPEEPVADVPVTDETGDPSVSADEDLSMPDEPVDQPVVSEPDEVPGDSDEPVIDGPAVQPGTNDGSTDEPTSPDSSGAGDGAADSDVATDVDGASEPSEPAVANGADADAPGEYVLAA